MEQIIRVIVVDDHDFFRTGLILNLKRLENVKVVGEAADGNEFLELLRTVTADVVFMDIKMPGMSGIEATKKASDTYRNLKIIALTMHDDKAYFMQMMQAGSKGFLLKNAGLDELKHSIETVMKHKNYYPSELVKTLFSQK